MTTPTSTEAYTDILQSEELGKSQKRVLKLLMDNGPMTGSEVNSALRCSSGHKRLSELEDKGVVHAGAPRACLVTGREAIVWHVTGRMPQPSKQALSLVPSRKQIGLAVDEIRRLIEFRRANDSLYMIPHELVLTGKWLRVRSKK